MDIALKPILKRLVAENPDERYESIFELRNAFLNLFMRFMDLDKVVVMTAAYERIKELRSENIAIEWINTSMYSTKERYEKEIENNGKKSYQNYLERNIIEKKLLELDTKLDQKIKVAVITGYSPQKYILQTMVRQHSFKYIEIDVDTVDAFQGSQKDIIIYSTVRSSANKYGIGFLKSEARINVAFSRARCLLIIVGDMNFLDNYKIRGNKFPKIIKYIAEADACRIIE